MERQGLPTTVIEHVALLFRDFDQTQQCPQVFDVINVVYATNTITSLIMNSNFSTAEDHNG